MNDVSILHVCGVSPEASLGGPIAFVNNGDSVTINAETRELTLHVDDATLAERRKGWTKPAPREKRGVMAKYARVAGSASDGATTS